MDDKNQASRKEPIATELAKKQREISISEFFTKNRHLLGFDNPTRALMMTVKEAVDNSLDACEEMRVLPEIRIKIDQLSEDRFRVIIEDNGPGIVKKQIPNVFAKLLYGSKFHRLKMSRGQQGIGISASVLYSQLTTGKPTKITSKIEPNKLAQYYELGINTKTNEPQIFVEKEVEWDEKDHGTKVEIELEAKYQKGKQSVDEYVKQTAISNPHALIIYVNPEHDKTEYVRATEELPKESKEIKPHPHGIELGTLIKMIHDTQSTSIQNFLQTDFSRIGPGTAKEIIDRSGIEVKKPRDMKQDDFEKLYSSLQKAKVVAPPTDCLSPISQEILEKGLRKEINAEFYATTTRPPAVYRGNPFIIEAGIAYGGEIEKDSTVRLLRFANRVPLLYQQGACAITEAATQVSWRSYGLQQSGSSLPTGPVVIVVHMASVWVPFTSESKESIASYDDIIKEIKLALQECGRKLYSYIRHNVRAAEEKERINLFEKYIPELANSLATLSDGNKKTLEEELRAILKKRMNHLL